MSEENVEIVRAVLQGAQFALEEDGDLGASFDLGVAAGVIAADAKLEPARELAGVTSYRGREGFVEFMRTWTEDFEGWSVEVERAIDVSDDLLVVVLRQTGTGKGSGVPVALSHGAVFDIQGGCVTRIRLFLEPAQALEAAGLSE
jgi:ketosteroid isomerase-like protein